MALVNKKISALQLAAALDEADNYVMAFKGMNYRVTYKQLKEAVNANHCACEVWNHNGHTSQSGVAARITWRRIVLANPDMFDPLANGVMTIPESGVYVASADIELSNLHMNNVGMRRLYFRNENTGQKFGQTDLHPAFGEPQNANRINPHCSGLRYLVKGHQVAVYFYQNSGININVGPEVGNSGHFTVARLF